MSLGVYLWFVGWVAQSRGGVWVFMCSNQRLLGTLINCIAGQTLCLLELFGWEGAWVGWRRMCTLILWAGG